MKKTLLNAALLALMTPISSIYGLGLGKMTVKSALDQPFLAEIEIVDVKSVALKDVRVGVADPANFEEIGLERAAVLSLLSFKIEKNEQGKEIIKVESTERMSEPYMELVVDLTWPEGQLYKAYTILLDPPGYRLVSSTIQGGAPHYKYNQKHSNEPGVIDKTVVTTVNHNPAMGNDNRKKASYGPTVTNDSIWQIAQRYKSADVILPQVVLAIVGANPEAFNKGNLNGLKVGVRLTIPATSDIAKVPADLATAEVMAHDKAWNDKQPIEHVLTPPYLSNNQNVASQNKPVSTPSDLTIVPSIPTPNSLPLIPAQVGNPLTVNPAPVQTTKPQDIEQDPTIKTEISLTAAAVESVREANALLMEQLRLLQKQNDKLQKQVEQRDKELKRLKSQIQVLVKQRQGLPSQATNNDTENSLSLWPILLLLLVGGGGAGFAYWYLKNRKPNSVKSGVPTTQSLDTDSPFIKPREEGNASQVVVETVKVKKPEAPPQTELMLVEPPVGQELAGKEHKLEEETRPKAADLDLENTVAAEGANNSELLTFESNQVQQKPSEADETSIKKEAKEESPIEFSKELATPKTDIESTSLTQESTDSSEEYLEFESGLHHSLSSSLEPLTVEEEKNEESIDFVLPDAQETNSVNLPKDEKEEKTIEVDESLSQFFVEDKPQNSDVEEESALETELKKDRLKSKKALETLLALAKTYISMDDFESARHSLEEVVEHGNKQQKEEANNLLQSIKDK
ncbi:FimV/HubP family polar landmark protein [Legionella sp. km772]|uniref:FimV/HubP family polar landmark protein n=1 Tax=Legionella sp. km772 TaxID=2498111 RepID=UPI000F8F7035|nr:FimV/HubP family polar landmark protein [Legionella sp. km772]RUR09331.1 pilus assembly protein FimV [Legionella sp. km772]